MNKKGTNNSEQPENKRMTTVTPRIDTCLKYKRTNFSSPKIQIA